LRLRPWWPNAREAGADVGAHVESCRRPGYRSSCESFNRHLSQCAGLSRRHSWRDGILSVFGILVLTTERFCRNDREDRGRQAHRGDRHLAASLRGRLHARVCAQVGRSPRNLRLRKSHSTHFLEVFADHSRPQDELLAARHLLFAPSADSRSGQPTRNTMIGRFVQSPYVSAIQARLLPPSLLRRTISLAPSEGSSRTPIRTHSP
jgi:hypothetical protein